MTNEKARPAYYAHVRYLGLLNRESGTNEAPLRIVDGQIAVKRKGYILPVIGLDTDGYALVKIAQDGFVGSYIDASAIARTPMTAEGRFDYEALKELAPSITNPWDVAELAGLKTVGEKPSDKPKASTAKPEPTTTVAATGLRITMAKPAAEKRAPKEQHVEAPKAAPVLDMDAVIAYLASVGQEHLQQVVTGVQAMKQQAAVTGRKSTKGKGRRA